jgi:glyoxylase-like metal-dependent hydrolase (beta-lactamase superfamily II)
MGTKLRALVLGEMGIDRELLVFPHPNYILTASRREGRKVWCECPAISYLIDHPDGLVLWETGIATTFAAEWAPEWLELIDMSAITPEMCLEGRLRALGVGPEDVRYVIQGHLHCDHAGGLRLFETAGAAIVCHEEEWKFVSQVERTDFFYSRADWNFLARRRPVTVYGDQEILRDLWLLSLPGHTPGTMGLLVKLAHTGWVLLTTDALYTHESYGPPAVGSPIVWDREKWAASVEKIRRVGAARNALVLPGHDLTGVQHGEGGVVGLRDIEAAPGRVYE